MGTYVKIWANLNGVNDTQSTWIQSICEAYGITAPVNGTWIEALARYMGATDVVNGTWEEALVRVMGLTLNGTWMQTLSEQGVLTLSEATAYNTRVLADSGIVEGFICFNNKLRFLKYN